MDARQLFGAATIGPRRPDPHSIHRYSLQNLLPDYLRGGAGLIIGGGGWLLAPGMLHVVVIFGGLTLLFLLFTMRTVARQYTRIEMTDDAITCGGTRRLALRWSDLDRVKLRYYSTRRNRSGGWMTLKLARGRTTISVDPTSTASTPRGAGGADDVESRGRRRRHARQPAALVWRHGAATQPSLPRRRNDRSVASRGPGGLLQRRGRADRRRQVLFRVPQGGTVALVGESGSGKSVISQTIMGILPHAAQNVGGKVLFADPLRPGSVTDIAALATDGAEMRAIRGGRISIIFQEPMTSLSPIHTVGNQIGEALHLHRKAGAAEGRELVTDMLRLVGFPDPAKALNTYPFELSGGLRQRAMIAMALICRPALLIADEPTTALDVTIQAQILKLMGDLQAELGMAVLIITHDLGVVANMAEEIVVLYHGKVMESGTLNDIFSRPTHPYLRRRCCTRCRVSHETRASGWCRSAK
jgi:ABC-type dipeptide/oligopeptide/nickel transport system ATPase component